jgi:hypothetical protein
VVIDVRGAVNEVSTGIERTVRRGGRLLHGPVEHDLRTTASLRPTVARAPRHTY